MPEITSYSLSVILKRIRSIIEDKTNGISIWIKAEISSITFHQQSGHYYLELVETQNNRIIAQCRAMIWKTSARDIRNELQVDFENVIKKGNEFLFQATIVFSEVYGLSLQINKVDLNFSLGDLEKRKQETIDRLKAEGIIDRNKTKKIPLVIKKIALIGSTTTNGYEDFYKQLKNNSYGYVFEVTDFPASVQGENAIAEITNQLELLNSLNYDIIAIVRGGGSKLDLDVFNNYLIAKAIALHNLPVFTGIGHEMDYSVADMVASKFHKTPTALGAYIVENAHNFEVGVNNSWVSIREIFTRYLDYQKSWFSLSLQTLTTKSISTTRLRRGDLHTIMSRINMLVTDEINSEKQSLLLSGEIIRAKPTVIIQNRKTESRNTLELIQMNFSGKIGQAVENNRFFLTMITTLALNQCADKRNNINLISEGIKMYHPDNILGKGYAIPLYNGGLLTNQKLKSNDTLEIKLKSRSLIVSYIKDK